MVGSETSETGNGGVRQTAFWPTSAGLIKHAHTRMNTCAISLCVKEQLMHVVSVVLFLGLALASIELAQVNGGLGFKRSAFVSFWVLAFLG